MKSSGNGADPRLRDDLFRRPFAELLTALTNLDLEVGSEEAGVRFSVDRLQLETPIEVTQQADPSDTLSVRASPPTQSIATSVMPTFHRLRLTIEPAPLEEDKGDKQHR